MKPLSSVLRFAVILCLSIVICSCERKENEIEGGIPPTERGDGNIAYQLLVYSFCDSNGDGIGDFNGITSKLDYLKEMGVTALWLSPIHPASSYHGYDVLDYSAVNPEYGTEEDFRNLVKTAASKGIGIYLDFVLNHTSKDHPWFKEAVKGPDNPYFEYYTLSLDPESDIRDGKVPMIAREGQGGYVQSQWYQAVSGSSGSCRMRFTLDTSNWMLTAEQVQEIENTGSRNSGVYLYYGDARMEEFYTDGSSVYTLSLDFESSWGLLVRTSKTSWDAGTKWGVASGVGAMQWGVPVQLNSTEAKDILPPGAASYMYHSHFETASFADLNYGPASGCEDSPAFKEVVAAAGKWIDMGVEGLRLDAVKHIYHSQSTNENPTFLSKFYEHCNAIYKARGGKGDFYMVGEVFDSYTVAAKYYAGLPSCFNFSYWWTLRDGIRNGIGNTFASEIIRERNEFRANRSEFIDAPKLSNHDEDRTGEELGKDISAMKLAGAVLLTSPGKPFIYQGEELGYWGNRGGGDQYVRSPVLWDNDGNGFAAKKLGSRIDRAMLSGSMAVSEQIDDEGSVLNLYRRFGDARSRYPALANGEIDEVKVEVAQMAVWTMSDGQQTLLVVHNFGKETKKVNLPQFNLNRCIVSNGELAIDGTRVQLGPHGSAVYLQ